jgi:CRISPR-associated Csx2 family protein
MARKVFISFLGSSFYGKCRYSSRDFTSSETRFVQQSSLEWINAKEWSNTDCAYILLTEGEKGSKNINWDYNSETRKNYQGQDEPYVCLRKVLESMDLPFQTIPIVVPNGKDEDEIWDIFKMIVSHLKNKDDLYLDLTHGFRYLPMLLLVLGNYAKFLKNVSVVHISYGNFEARDTATNIAPFVDLLPFSKLQDWTIASKDFIDYGKVDDLHQLLEEKYKSIHRKKNTEENALINVDKKLKQISESISANKLDDIIKGENLHDEINILRDNNEIIPEPFFPLLEKIENKLEKFGQSDLENVFAATDWCIKHELYQNAYSILLEGIISIVLNQIDEKYEGMTPLIETKRGILAYVADCKIAKDNITRDAKYTKEICVAGYSVPAKLKNETEQLKSIVGKIWDFIDKDIANVIVALNAKRNSFMHAGTGTNQLGSFADLKSKIEKYNNDLSNWYKTLKQ